MLKLVITYIIIPEVSYTLTIYRPFYIPNSGPLGLPPGGSDGREETRTDSVRGGTEGRTGGGPGISCTLPVTSGKDQGLDCSAAVHSQWDRDGGPGMAQRPLPTVWNGAPRPSHAL